MAVIQVQVIPVGTDEASISSHIAACHDKLQRCGLPHQVTAAATIIQADAEAGVAAALDMHRTLFRRGVDRVVTTIMVDERQDEVQDMTDMVEAVLHPIH